MNDKDRSVKSEADYIMSHLDGKNIEDRFSEEFFDLYKVSNLLDTINHHCDWKNRELINSLTRKGYDPPNMFFIYEVKLDCNNLKFILTYEYLEEKYKFTGFEFVPLAE